MKKHRSSISGEFVSADTAKAHPETTVTESDGRSDAIATLTINSDGMTNTERARLGFWLMSQVWHHVSGRKTVTYDPDKWKT